MELKDKRSVKSSNLIIKNQSWVRQTGKSDWGLKRTNLTVNRRDIKINQGNKARNTNKKNGEFIQRSR